MREIITVGGRTDGFGAQYFGFMTGFARARHDGYIYRHTPMERVGHDQSHNANKLNKFIGMKSDADDEPQRPVDFSGDWFNPPVYHGDLNEYFNHGVRNELREMYYSTSKPKPCRYDVAMHIRRGDIKRGDRYVKITDYVSYVRQIKKLYPEYSICVYSEGELDNFKMLHNKGLDFKLGGDITRAFHDFVTAKVLIVGHSCFSYSAAMLREERDTYVLNRSHQRQRRLSHWKRLDI
jgi:hypothetical protein